MLEINKYGVGETSSGIVFIQGTAKISQLVKAKEMSLHGHLLNTFCLPQNSFKHLLPIMKWNAAVAVTMSSAAAPV
jgi:hypothetical protein